MSDRRFRARADVEAWDLPPGIAQAGYYRDRLPDGTVVYWLGRCARARLPAGAQGEVHISGVHHPELHRRAGHELPLRLTFTLDGRELGSIELAEVEQFEASFELPPVAGRTGPGVLSIHATGTFVPAEIGLGQDRRTLSVQLHRCEFDGQDLLAARGFAPTSAPGVNLVGYASSEHGVGESVRLAQATFAAIGLPHSLIDFSVGVATRNTHPGCRGIGAAPTHAVNLFHINADQIPTAYAELGAELFRGRYNIGYWHWELPELPDEVLDSFALLDEVWVPTYFVMDAVAAKSPIPVVRIPHGIELAAPAGASRTRFGLPPDRFLFLTMYDFLSYQERKNPLAAIRAFRAAFGQRRDVALVIKAHNSEHRQADKGRLLEAIAGLPSVFVIDETLDRADVTALQSVCDAFVSLHRSEGFGLPLAECMALAKPVLGTAWSGNADFMDDRNSVPVDYELVRLATDVGVYRKGQVWAEPDEDHAAWAMRRLVEQSDWRHMLAANASRTMREKHARAVVGNLAAKRLSRIAERIGLST